VAGGLFTSVNVVVPPNLH